MNDVVVNKVRKGFYLDSVALMRLSRKIAEKEGIREAALMMGTPQNREIMTNAGLLEEAGRAAEGGDLVIAIRAITRETAETALIESESYLDQPMAAGGEGVAWRPRTLRAAVKSMPEANLVLISVPGDFAIAEARKAIRRGLHTMIFSDNVPLEEEAALKREARELGCLVMGPDCGTAIINGTPLAFANSVPRGEIGIVGASGTGTQEVTCLIAQYGGGISQAIGVGGRDLKSEVGGISTLMALDALEADPKTKQVVLISKPPPTEVASRVLERIAACRKPVIICFIGSGELTMPTNAVQVYTLKDAARKSLGLSLDGIENPDSVRIGQARRACVHGLFSGGTLCAEAQVIFRAAGEIVRSNSPVPGASPVNHSGEGHLLLDLGDDQYTLGKPHPMIDPTVRDEMLINSVNDITVGIILVDLVIGYGAHEDPAGHFAKILKANANNDQPIILASVTGTDRDPQNRTDQIAKLKSAGVLVAPTNADAANWAITAIQSRRGEVH